MAATRALTWMLHQGVSPAAPREESLRAALCALNLTHLLHLSLVTELINYSTYSLEAVFVDESSGVCESEHKSLRERRAALVRGPYTTSRHPGQEDYEFTQPAYPRFLLGAGRGPRQPGRSCK